MTEDTGQDQTTSQISFPKGMLFFVPCGSKGKTKGVGISSFGVSQDGLNSPCPGGLNE